MSAIAFVCFGIVIVGTACMLWHNIWKPQKRVIDELERQRALASTTSTNANTRAAEGPGSNAVGDLALALPPYTEQESAGGDHSGEGNDEPPAFVDDDDEPPPFVDDGRGGDVPAVAVTV
ncbi:hypothetical protein HDU89_002872 [Geranomyces variabilis]|nr:hypothetical protein HDU89_002872 [Geranomyces variabilis]